MKRALRYLTFINLLFILLLSLSGMLDGILSSVIYYLAFIIPIAVVFAIKRRTGAPFAPPSFRLSGGCAKLLCALAFPTVALIFLLSFLTSLILFSLGLNSSGADVSGNLLLALISHALLPAILEEALFRYLPIALLAPYSKKWCVILSAASFALIHCNIFQIPYAFVAGIVFAAIDVASDSILPSFILHLMNNVLSVLWMRSENGAPYVILIFSLALASVVALIMMRRALKKAVSPILEDKSKLELSYEPFLLLAVTLVAAIT